MRISVWLYFLQQMGCTLCLLGALGGCAGLGMPRMRRLVGLAMVSAAVNVLAAMAGGWLVRALALGLHLLLPLGAWGRMSFSMWVRLMVPMGMMMALLTGLMRLGQGWLPGTLGVLLGCMGMMLVAPARRRGLEGMCTSLTVRMGMTEFRMAALVDSGNLLRDHVTGLPVIVLSRTAAGCMMALPEAGELLPGMRYLPIRTAAGSALMVVVRPDAVRLSFGGRDWPAEALLGVSPDASAGFTALVPACLLREKETKLGQTAQMMD